jgi:chromosome segregation ATPase
MSLAKTIDELERHIDYAASYFADVKSELEQLETDYTLEIHELQKDVETISEQNELLEEQVEDLKKTNTLLQFELMEVTMELTKLKHELDISR